MPPPINNQPPLQTPRHPTITPLPTPIRNTLHERLAHHLRQKNRQRIIVSEPRNLNRHLHPRAMPLPRRLSLATITSIIITGSGSGSRRLRPQSSFLNFSLNTHDSLRSVSEAHARGAVRAGQDVRLCGEGPELCCGAAVGANRGVGEGKRSVEVGELCWGEVRGLRGRGGLALGGHFLFSLLSLPGLSPSVRIVRRPDSVGGGEGYCGFWFLREEFFDDDDGCA